MLFLIFISHSLSVKAEIDLSENIASVSCCRELTSVAFPNTNFCFFFRDISFHGKVSIKRDAVESARVCQQHVLQIVSPVNTVCQILS